MKRSTLRISKPRTDKFFFCWSPERNRPRARHATYAEAVAEAERLTELHVGVEFCVFEAKRLASRKVRA